MKNTAKKVGLALSLVACAWVLSYLQACHTVEGAGEDISAAGSGIANTSEDVRPYDK